MGRVVRATVFAHVSLLAPFFPASGRLLENLTVAYNEGVRSTQWQRVNTGRDNSQDSSARPARGVRCVLFSVVYLCVGLSHTRLSQSLNDDWTIQYFKVDRTQRTL